MSEAPDESQKAKKQCVVFEPQAWRKTLCRNCFKTKNDHAAASDVDDQQQKPTTPVANDDYVVIPRREGTPIKDRSRSSTPIASSTPAASAATTVGKNILMPEQDTCTVVEKENSSKTNKDAPADKKKDKTINKTCSEVDKNSHLSKAENKVEAAVGEGELQKQNQSSAAHAKHKKSDDGKTLNVDSEQSADAKPETAQQSTAAALSQAAKSNEAGNAVNIQGHSAASEAPTSAAEPVAVGIAVNSSAAIKSYNKAGAATSVTAADQPHPGTESSRCESSHHGNASSSQAMLTNVEQNDIQKVNDTSGSTTNTRGPAIDEDGGSSGSIAMCMDDAAASAVAAVAAASVANSRSSKTSDEIVGDVARSAEASRADDTEIDLGSGERSVAAAGSTVGQDVEAEVRSASCEVNAGLAEDVQSVRQLDLTLDQRVGVCATGIPGVQSDLFTNGDVANSRSDTISASSIAHATAVDESGGAYVEQQSPALRVDNGAATGNDSAPELTSCDSAAGHAKVEATITLSGSSSSYAVDNSRPIHIVSAVGISGYQRGGGGSVWTSAASENVDDFAVDPERSRLPPDYEQSAGYSSSSVSSDDAYGPTSPLVEYLSRSPFARSLHGATERSPETEIVATGGGGETSLFHHVPAASDGDKSDTAAGVGVAELSNDTRDWEAERSRNGCAVRPAADSDTDARSNIITRATLC